jgi:hypothetical protein
MLRRLLTTAGVAGIVAFVVAGGALVVASSCGSDGPVKTITVIEQSRPGHFIDLGKKGFSMSAMIDLIPGHGWFDLADVVIVVLVAFGV